jgi:hypothetical protein
MTLLPILDKSYKGWVLQIAKVPFQIRLKTSGQKTRFTRENLFCFDSRGTLAREITEPFRKIKTKLIMVA